MLCFIRLGLILLFSLLVKRLAGKIISDMIYLVSTGTLKLNSVNRSISPSHQCKYLLGHYSLSTNNNNNNNNNNIYICIAPYGRNFRGAGLLSAEIVIL